MAGGKHRARGIQGTGGVVQLVGGAQSDEGHIDALGARAVAEGLRQRRATVTHVVGDGKGVLAIAANDGAEGRSDVVSELRVECLPYDASDIVGLDDAVNQFSAAHGLLLWK